MHAIGSLGHLGFFPGAVTRFNANDWPAIERSKEEQQATLRRYLDREPAETIHQLDDRSLTKLVANIRARKLTQYGNQNTLELRFEPNHDLAISDDGCTEQIVICNGRVIEREVDSKPTGFATALERTALMEHLIPALKTLTVKHLTWSLSISTVNRELFINLSIGQTVPSDVDQLLAEIAAELNSYLPAYRP